jgi:uncharacterized protein YegP (UPF0339 family)
MTIKIYRDKRREWRWTLVAKNGRKIACSGDGYKRRIDLVTTLATIRLDFGSAPVTMDRP